MSGIKLDTQGFLNTLHYTIQPNLGLLRATYVEVESSFRDKQELQQVEQLSKLEVDRINDVVVLREMITLALKKQRLRARKKLGAPQRKTYRNHIAVADSILRTKRFGCFEVEALFQFDIETHINHLDWAQHHGKWRGKCDCGRVAFKRTHHLEAVMQGKKQMLTCGPLCGLKNKPKPEPPKAFVPESARLAFAALLSDEPVISDSEPKL